jgi:hypothetical protein
MVNIETYCTIVNTKVQAGSTLVDDPSGWDERLIMTDISNANAILKPANVQFKLTGKINTITVTTHSNSGKVDGTDFETIGATINAQTFTPRKVRVAFIKKFAGVINRGKSAQAWCYACVELPDKGIDNGQPNMAQAGWVLAHEFGHLLGLGHNCTNDQRLMHYSWLASVGSTISKPEIAIIKAHAHVDPKVQFVAPTEKEPACRR